MRNDDFGPFDRMLLIGMAFGLLLIAVGTMGLGVMLVGLVTAPKGVEIGRLWLPKRGRRVAPLVIKQVHRADRSCAVGPPDNGYRVEMTWKALRKDWTPTTVVPVTPSRQERGT